MKKIKKDKTILNSDLILKIETYEESTRTSNMGPDGNHDGTYNETTETMNKVYYSNGNIDMIEEDADMIAYKTKFKTSKEK